MYELETSEARDFAGSLVSEFEVRLAAEVDQLSGHSELAHYATRTGHRTRPVGTLLASSAVGGDWRDALNAAVAIELIHKASVIRDDVVDGDQTRSGQVATHTAFGLPRALAVSDVLWSRALTVVGRGLSRERACECVSSLGVTLHEMAAGQLEDVAPSVGRGAVAERALVDEQKTGALSGRACWLGAFIGGGDPTEVRALEMYGRKLGTAFQVLNDVRNLSGAEGSRTAASDVRLRRDTVLSAFARAHASASSGDVLARVEPNDELGADEVDLVRDAMLSAGACEFGEQFARRLMNEARAHLEVLEPSVARRILESLTHDGLLAYAF